MRFEKERVMKHCFALALASSFALTAGCDGQQLSRAKAAELIKKHFPQPVTDRVLVGKKYTGSTTREQYLSTTYGRLYKLEEEDGLLKMQDLGTPKGGSFTVDISLTPKGETYQVSENKQLGFVTVKMCEQTFVEITGVAVGDKGTALVEYTWKLGNLTPFALRQNEVMTDQILPCSNLSPQKATVGFKVFDDGWRILE
jgi:hypothetical protein